MPSWVLVSIFIPLLPTAGAMNMPDTSGNSPNANLSLSDPNCTDESCTAFLNAENESQATVSFSFQFLYGHWVTYYYVIILGILIAIHKCRQILDARARKVGNGLQDVSLNQRATALGRYVFYRRFQPLSRFGLPSVGVLAFLFITIVFLAALLFGVKPYYREHLGYGSPPLAIRAGLMSFACTPILIALAGKANIITLLSGISHEKLNVVHGWVAWMSFALALFHTIPFFLQSYWEGPFYHVSSFENVKIQFYWWGTQIGASEFSGVPPLAILFGLCILSLPCIRARFYESFYYTHILMGVTYLGLLFWHAADTLDSWAYLWATLALWTSSWLARMFWYTRPLNIKQQWFIRSPTIIQSLPGGMTSLQVLAPEGFTWNPAQHCFLRFPDISVFDNHPFTIISTPATKSPKKYETQSHLPSLSFLVRTRSGFTAKLANYCKSEPDTVASAWIDGPYGGISPPVERLFDNVLLIAGGSGISACLPWLTFLTANAGLQSPSTRRVKKVVLIWVFRDVEHFSWIENEISAALSGSNENPDTLDIVLQFHVTRGTPPASSVEIIPTAKEMGLSKNLDPVIASVRGDSSRGLEMQSIGKVSYTRPVMAEVVNDHLAKGKTLVLGCGPQSLRDELSNVCAKAQGKVLKGEIQEIAMHLETFGW